MRIIKALVIAIITTTLVLYIQYGVFAPKKPLPSVPGQTPILTAQPNQGKTGELNILFIGNSYTFMHSMPQMIINMAKSDKQNAIKLNIQSITISSARLKEHWKNGNAAKLLQQNHWNYVIFQDQSNWATEKGGERNNYVYLIRFLSLTQNSKTIHAIFKTWPKQKDSAWYVNPNLKRVTHSYEIMRRALDRKTKRNAQKTGIEVVPISDYWLYILDNEIPIRLYEQDGSHPSVAGSYLNALIFYRYFTMSDLKSITYLPYGIKPEETQQLREIAALGDLK